MKTVKEWILRCKYKRDNNLEYNFAVIFNGGVVGGCGIKIYQEYKHIGEIGYFIDKNYSVIRTVTEIAKNLEEIAFNELNLVRLEIKMDPRNKASEKVTIKNNYKKEGLLREAIEFRGSYYDNLSF
ncbi:GNAT family N-acetyltransferase [Caloranaerobacter azorensis]|uniref:GNAT family N-acetyltransferase n=1 Tax=Caloranaerobacter azorensis TaxID=116090 RepID=A0A6P1YGG6_9FIRM|nr:GNAT family N-acetyltransferase [Caloranaerobacter azorensis]